MLDSAAHIQASLDALQTMAAAGMINGITLTDANPVLTITATQMARDSDALQDIQGDYSLNLIGTAAASAVTSATAEHVGALAVSGSAADVAANIANLGGVAEAVDLSIRLSDPETPTLTVSAGQADSRALAAIDGPFPDAGLFQRLRRIPRRRAGHGAVTGRRATLAGAGLIPSGMIDSAPGSA